jgi:AcrR family transcriptional regulator
MGIQERREREKGELKSLIMDTARRLFAAEGYEAVSMRRIADAIEYSATAIYVHFKDKDALIREICLEDYGKLSAMSAKLGKVADPIERIRHLGISYIRFAVKHPNHYRLMFMTPHKDVEMEPEYLELQGNPDADGYAFLLHTVREAFDAGRFRPELTNPVLITQILWATVHGVASLQIAKANDGWVKWAPLEERIDLATDAILRGLLATSKKRGGK